MPKPVGLFLWVVLLLNVCGSSLVAARVRYTVDKVWTAEETGLPGNAVIAIRQTRDGYLWLGTLNGLARFDGEDFTVFDDSNTPELSDNCIVKLFEDSRTNLWIGTRQGGVVRVDPEGKLHTMAVGRNVPEGRLVSICEDGKGAIWLLTADGQLARYYAGKLERWPYAGIANGCRAVISEGADRVWVGIDRFVASLPAGNALPVEPKPPWACSRGQFYMASNKLDFLLTSKGGGYWRFADGEIQKWRADRLESAWAYPWGVNVPVYVACEDRDGNLIVGTLGEGLFCFDAAGQFTQITTKDGLSHDWILSLCVDREGCLWVGTDSGGAGRGGLNRLKRPLFDAITGAPDAPPQSVAEDGQGGVWVGFSSGGGVGCWTNGMLKTYGSLEGLSNQNVRAVFVDRTQRVWAGTAGGLYEMSNGRFVEAFRPPVAARLSASQAEAWHVVHGPVSAIYQDRRGTLWVGTHEGLAWWDGRNWQARTVQSGLTANGVQAIVEDAGGNLWVGTESGGLLRVSQGQIATFSKTNGLPNNNVSSLLVDSDDVLWVGTGSGLARCQHGQWRTFTKRDGLVSNNLGYLVEDKQGYLWIGSDKGLMRVLKKALNETSRKNGELLPIRTYGKPDGLPTGECTFSSQPGAARTRAGRLWFPTSKGLVSVDPSGLTRNPNPPPVVIESVWVDDQLETDAGLRSPLPAKIVVPAGKETLDISFASLSLSAPQRTAFRYRLEGHEKNWTAATLANRKAHYSQLEPNPYTFQVQACNEDGVWNTTGASLAITVLPPFWRTWWFISLSGGCLLLLVVGSVHYVSTQRLQRQLEGLRQKEALEKERARIARDIHDQVGANLTQVSLLGELVESDKECPEEVEAHARQISQTALETTRALDEIVWTVNPSNDTLDGLINYICKYAQEYLAMAELRYRLETPEQLPATPITPELRHNVFLAAKEAVNNVVKHSKATAAHLRLQIEPHRFVLEVEDNGRGVAPGSENKGRNGLRNMRKRMEDVGGQFEIGPGAEGGTKVRLVAPLK